jgi:hypothetical protein
MIEGSGSGERGGGVEWGLGCSWGRAAEKQKFYSERKSQRGVRSLEV